MANFTQEAQKAVVELEFDGSLLDAKEVAVPAGEIGGVVFPLATAPAGKLTARLKYDLDTPDKRDALQQDDVGYAAINDAKPGRVLVVTPGNVALQVALATTRSGRLANIQLKTPDVLATRRIQTRRRHRGVRPHHLRSMCAGSHAPGEHPVHWPLAARAGLAREGRDDAIGKKKDSKEPAADDSERISPSGRRSSIGIVRTRC